MRVISLVRKKASDSVWYSPRVFSIVFVFVCVCVCVCVRVLFFHVDALVRRTGRWCFRSWRQSEPSGGSMA